MRSITLVIVFACTALVGARSPGAALGKSPDAAADATLDGRAVSMEEAVTHHCHDQYGSLRCFSDPDARDRSVAASSVGRVNNAAFEGQVAAVAAGYVVVYEHITFGGASVVLSRDYADLSTIGWNDRVSSYKVYTTLTGYFYEHSNYWGLRHSFCCFSQNNNVGGTYNDRFSSFELP